MLCPSRKCLVPNASTHSLRSLAHLNRLLVKAASWRIDVPSSWLLLVSRILVAWAVPVVVVIWMDNACWGGWTLFWDHCHSEQGIEQMDVHGPSGWTSIPDMTGAQHLVSVKMVNASHEICLQNALNEAQYTRTNPRQCARAVVSTMAPLLIKKLAIAALVLPAITVRERVRDRQTDRQTEDRLRVRDREYHLLKLSILM